MYNEQELRMITRHSAPSFLDTAEYRVICKEIKGFDIPVDYYIQLSHDPDSPRWEFLGSSMSDTTLLKLIELLK